MGVLDSPYPESSHTTRASSRRIHMPWWWGVGTLEWFSDVPHESHFGFERGSCKSSVDINYPPGPVSRTKQTVARVCDVINTRRINKTVDFVRPELCS